MGVTSIRLNPENEAPLEELAKNWIEVKIIL
jgi:hypothetical protein